MHRITNYIAADCTQKCIHIVLCVCLYIYNIQCTHLDKHQSLNFFLPQKMDHSPVQGVLMSTFWLLNAAVWGPPILGLSLCVRACVRVCVTEIPVTMPPLCRLLTQIMMHSTEGFCIHPADPVHQDMK